MADAGDGNPVGKSAGRLERAPGSGVAVGIEKLLLVGRRETGRSVASPRQSASQAKPGGGPSGEPGEKEQVPGMRARTQDRVSRRAAPERDRHDRLRRGREVAS